MSNTFDIDLHDGHLIFILDGLKVLVDTGCPVTISKQNTFCFMGGEYWCQTSFGGRNINSISQLMNYDIDVFMGMDIIKNFYILTDYKHRQVSFSLEPIPIDPLCSIPILRGNMGEVCVNLVVKGNTLKLALDTGARISYIAESFTQGEIILEIKDDFNPIVGNYQTPIFAMEATIGSQTFPVNFGTLPSMLAMPMQMMGISGAIGYDLYHAFTVLMDFKHNTLSIK